MVLYSIIASDLFASNLSGTMPERPAGVIPAKYIGQNNIQKHDGVRCALCVEEKARHVPQLTLPRIRTNEQKSVYCSHVYTYKHGAVFYWNTNGSTFARRVDGSAEYTSPDGLVKQYGVGTYEQPEGYPFVSSHELGFGVARARNERYYEELFQQRHPLASTADEGLLKCDQVTPLLASVRVVLRYTHCPDPSHSDLVVSLCQLRAEEGARKIECLGSGNIPNVRTNPVDTDPGLRAQEYRTYKFWIPVRSFGIVLVF
ncbi:hypothetical protein PENSPDRAFT_134760 [Peniophora sp. CONT]|nr:hypothetical protein PENSPDRAFT_134760 [Peniophora sp. CONT]